MNDPSTAEFFYLFNDVLYKPIVPDDRKGITEYLFLSFDQFSHTHKRSEMFL